MALVVLSIDRSKFPAHTEAEFKEWVEYQYGGGAISCESPLIDCGPDSEIREIGSLDGRIERKGGQ